MLRWILFADVVVIIFVLILGMAVQATRVEKLKNNLKSIKKKVDIYEKTLNRAKIRDTISKELYQDNILEMQVQIEELQHTVDRQVDLLKKKEQQIISLKMKGNNNHVNVSL